MSRLTRAAVGRTPCGHSRCGARCDYEPIPYEVLLAEVGACARPECFWTSRIEGRGLAHDAPPVSDGSGSGDGRHRCCVGSTTRHARVAR